MYMISSLKTIKQNPLRIGNEICVQKMLLKKYFSYNQGNKIILKILKSHLKPYTNIHYYFRVLLKVCLFEAVRKYIKTR